MNLQVGRASIEVQIHRLSRCPNADLGEVLAIIVDILSLDLADLAVLVRYHEAALSDNGRLSLGFVVESADFVVGAALSYFVHDVEGVVLGWLEVVCNDVSDSSRMR